MLKTNIKQISKINNATRFAGMVLMTSAAVMSSIVAPDPGYSHSDKSYKDFKKKIESHRHEKEETGPHHASYNLSQRTPARASSL